jgi:transposase
MTKTLTNPENYTCHEIASILSLNLLTVRHWIQRGWLKANQSCPKYYQVKPGNLKQFLEKPPHQIKKRITSLDSQAISYLLKGKA